jgi:hypothetical protein
MRRLILVAAALAAVMAFAQDAPPRLELSVRLFNALFDAPPQPKEGPVLLMYTARVPDADAPGGAHWERVWGMARDYNASNCLGRITVGEVTDARVRLGMEMLIGDPWNPGGRARYQIDLEKRPADAAGAIRLEGTYSGTYRGVVIRGKADGEIMPPRPKLAAGFEPVKPGEHPRILFRRGDLPRLKALAETPFGKACLASMRGPVADGVRYQLTGDKQFAESARAQCEGWLLTGWAGKNTGNWPGNIEQLATSYDLCYDAWPAVFRSRVERYMLWGSTAILSEQMPVGPLWHVGVQRAATLLASAGFVGLALWGEPGPPPGKPISPSEADRIAPADEYTPPDGVPVVPLESGVSPKAWLALPALTTAVDGDPLLELGGVERARPQVGTEVTWGEFPAAFAPLAKEFIMPEGGIYLSTMQETSDATLAFYCVLKNDHKRTVRISNPQTKSGRPLMILNGNVLHDGRVIEVDEGLYPLLIVGRFTARWAGLKPMLVDASQEDIESARDELARRQGEYRQASRDWEDDHAEWKRLGGADARFLKLFLHARQMCFLYAREAADADSMAGAYGTGDPGYQAQAGFVSAYRMMFGEDVSPYRDVAYVLQRKLFGHLTPPNQVPTPPRNELRFVDMAQDINGDPSIDLTMLQRAFPGLPDADKPVALWLWNRRAGLTGPATTNTARGLNQGDPVRAFVTYPFDMAPKAPGEVMPLTWQAPVFGQYGFRNAWAGTDDIIVQTFGKSHVIGGWNAGNAGTFRVFGFGKAWATGPLGLERWRCQENVVQFPDDAINEAGLAPVTYAKAEKDGSGVVTYDMREVYAGRQKNFLGQNTERMYDRYGGGRRAAAFADLGITGKRAFGVDYSGKSGAPCLLVIVDDITGGKKKRWCWQQAPGMVATERGFTITQDGAVLKGTLITPTTAKPEVTTRPLTMQGRSRYDVYNLPNLGVYAQGESFFVVCTLGKGAQPDVKVEGAGLKAVVTVGGRTVRYDGEKVVFGDAP